MTERDTIYQLQEKLAKTETALRESIREREKLGEMVNALANAKAELIEYGCVMCDAATEYLSSIGHKDAAERLSEDWNKLMNWCIGGCSRESQGLK